MSLDAKLHTLIWWTPAGKAARWFATWLGLLLLRGGRRLLRWSLGRCSWCGANPGFQSTVSRKGLRCDTLTRKCTEEPT